MSDTTTCAVIATGQIKSGFDINKVQESFAVIFKLPLDQAKKIVGTEKVLKKGLDREKAQLYKDRLEKIGLVVTIDPPAVKRDFSSLALEPIETDTPEEPTSNIQSSSLTKNDSTMGQASTTDAVFSCPKCGLEQPKSSECQGCGIFFEKYNARMAEGKINEQSMPVSSINKNPEMVDKSHEEHDDVDEEEKVSDVIIPKAMLAAAGAAIVGALVWKFIAVTFGYELGFLAWGIGGLVGFTAAQLGSRGDYSAAICGVLALLSILGGKYLIIEGYKSDYKNILTSEYSVEDFQPVYEEEIQTAKIYVDVASDEASQRRFMVDYEYTDYLEPSEIPLDEFQMFTDSIAPNLRYFASSPSIEEWMDVSFASVQDQIGEISTFDLIKEDFSWIDLLFYFFGISTAFRLGRGY